MESLSHDGKILLDELQNAGSSAEVMSILADLSRVKLLSPYAKEPAVRKALMLAATLDPNADERARLRTAALFAAFGVEKPLRSMVDEYAPRILAEPLSPALAGLSGKEKSALAGWLSTRKNTWIADFALQVALVEAADEPLCLSYLQIAISRAPSLSSVLLKLGEEFSREPGLVEVGKRRNLIAALNRIAEKGAFTAGRGMPAALRAIVMDCVLQREGEIGMEDRTRIALAVCDLLSTLCVQNHGLVLSEVPYEIVQTLQGAWIAPSDKKWKAFKKVLFGQIGKLVALFAIQGVQAEELLRKARLLEMGAGSIERMCRDVVENNDISSEDVAQWLLRGGATDEAGAAKPREASSENELIARIMIRLDELLAIDPERDPRGGKAVRDNLATELGRLTKRRALELDAARDAVVPFDPARQRAVGSVEAGGQVRVLSPGVVRLADEGRLQIVPAIVEEAKDVSDRKEN